MEKNELKTLFLSLIKEDEDFKKEVFSVLSDLFLDSSSIDLSLSYKNIDEEHCSEPFVSDVDSCKLIFSNSYVFDKLINTDYFDSFVFILNDCFERKFTNYQIRNIFSNICKKYKYHDIPSLENFKNDVDSKLKLIKQKIISESRNKKNNNQVLFSLILDFSLNN